MRLLVLCVCVHVCVCVCVSVHTLSHVWLFCDPTDWSPPGFSVHRIFQAKIVEWVAVSYSRASSRPRDWTCVSCVGREILYHWAHSESESEVAQLCLTLCDPWTVAHQAPLSVGFSRQEYCSGLPFPSPGDLPNPGIEPRSPTLQADVLPSEPPRKSIPGH